MAGPTRIEDFITEFRDLEGQVFPRVARKQLTSAQILALFTTPITVVPAPGINRFVYPAWAIFQKPAGTAYTVAAQKLQIRFKNAVTIIPVSFPATDLLASALRRSIWSPGQSSGPTGDTLELKSADSIENSALEALITVSNVTLGTSPVNLIVAYWEVQSNFAFSPGS